MRYNKENMPLELVAKFEAIQSGKENPPYDILHEVIDGQNKKFYACQKCNVKEILGEYPFKLSHCSSCNVCI